MTLIIILKIIITIFINNDINFLKLDLSLIYMVYIHVAFFFYIFILCRNLSKTSDLKTCFKNILKNKKT